MTQDEFFDRVASVSGYVEPDTVRRIYNGMLRVVYEELRGSGSVRLPALCDIRIILSRGKRIQNRHMDISIVKKPFHQIRIQPLATIRNYFKALDERLNGTA